eukprot:scaffold3467_cov64-Phaeocystis_antarctica.AAC.2
MIGTPGPRAPAALSAEKRVKVAGQQGISQRRAARLALRCRVEPGQAEEGEVAHEDRVDQDASAALKLPELAVDAEVRPRQSARADAVEEEEEEELHLGRGGERALFWRQSLEAAPGVRRGL